jgi:hypothetical protein
MSSEVARYFVRLRAHLRLGDGFESEIVRELQAHIDDRVAELGRNGVQEDRARGVAIRALGRPQTLAHLLRQAEMVTPWAEALFGAAAFVLLALMIGPGLWQQPLAALAASMLVVGVTLYGLWAGRPAWFYPWAGVALTIPVMVGYVAFELLHRELPSIATHPGPVALAGVTGSALYFAVGLVVVGAAVAVAVRRDWLDASILLSPLPGVLVWVISQHRSGGILNDANPVSVTSALLCGVFVCMALATVLFLRAPERSLKVTTLVGSALVLFAGSTFLLDPAGDVVTMAGRAALLLAFLLSPALVARHA